MARIARSTSGRVVALDLGDRRIGVAVSDTARTVATPYGVIDRKRAGTAELLGRAVGAIVGETGATEVVVGLPLSLDGTVGPAARRALQEADILRSVLEVPVNTADERLSTVEAARSLRAAGTGARRARRRIDSVAATVLLQAWLGGQPDSR